MKETDRFQDPFNFKMNLRKLEILSITIPEEYKWHLKIFFPFKWQTRVIMYLGIRGGLPVSTKLPSPPSDHPKRLLSVGQNTFQLVGSNIYSKNEHTTQNFVSHSDVPYSNTKTLNTVCVR